MEETKNYRSSPAAKYICAAFALTLLSCAAYSLFKGNIGYFATLSVLSMPWLVAYAIGGREWFINENSVEHKSHFGHTFISYGDIYQIILSGSTIDAVQIYKTDRFWPHLSVPYMTEDYEDLARNLIERVPPGTEVVDFMGITDEVKQGVKWEGKTTNEVARNRN